MTTYKQRTVSEEYWDRYVELKRDLEEIISRPAFDLLVSEQAEIKDEVDHAEELAGRIKETADAFVEDTWRPDSTGGQPCADAD